MSEINYNLLFKIGGDSKITALMDKISVGVKGISTNVDSLNKKFNSLPQTLNNSLGAIKLNAVLDQINRVTSGLAAVSKPGADLSNKMFDLQAMTGVAGDKLKEIEGYARNAAKTFGGSAADNAESYKLILGQLSPEIAKVPAALQLMGNSVSVTSKLMGGNSVAATELLTTAMNQYSVSTDNPIAASKTMAGMMNVMAAAAKQGSAELPAIQQALSNSGMAAKAAGLSFEETNVAIQILDKAGMKAGEGGTALRNMLAIMQQGRFMPKETQEALAKAGVSIATLSSTTIPFTQRLQTLTPVMHDNALMTKLFGMENKNGAMALIANIDAQKKMQQQVTGTNEALQQSAIVMQSPAEKADRLRASIDDFKISLFNGTNGLFGYMGVIAETTSTVTDLIPLFTNASKITKLWTGAQALFNTVMKANPIVLVISAVMILIGVISYVISKTEGWGKLWQHTVSGAGLLWQAFSSDAQLQWDAFITAVSIGLDTVRKGWYEFENIIHAGDKNQNIAIINQLDADIKKREKTIQSGVENVKKLYGQAAAEFSVGFNSLHWKSDKSNGIAAPTLAGSAVPVGGSSNQLNAGGNNASGNGKTTNDAISTGGTKNTTVYINIGKQIENFKLETTNIQEGAEKIRQILVDELTRAIMMGASLGSGT